MSAEIANPTTDQIIASALRLPAAERVQIVNAIKRSLIDDSVGQVPAEIPISAIEAVRQVE
jgi:hypothetical protein